MTSSTSKLLFICHGFPPYYGGAEHAAYDLAREAVKSGSEVCVLTSDIGGRLPSEETCEGIRIIRLPARKKEWTFHTSLELLDFLRVGMRRLPAIVKEVQPDAIWAHFSMPAGALALQAHRRFGIPYGVVLQGSDVPGYQPDRFRFLYPLLKVMVRRIWHKAAAVVAVSDELRKLALQTWPSGTINVIPNGVNEEQFSPRPQQDRDGGKLQAVVAAQLIERKGIQFLLKALTLLDAPTRDAVTWRIFGTGPYEGKLRELISTYGLQDHVRLEGLVPRDELAEILCGETDLFVLPTLQEGLPLALLEALAAGLAVVATRVGGIPAALTHEQDALLVEPGCPEVLRDAIVRLVPSFPLRERLRVNARETAMNYTWRACWEQYWQVTPGHPHDKTSP